MSPDDVASSIIIQRITGPPCREEDSELGRVAQHRVGREALEVAVELGLAVRGEEVQDTATFTGVHYTPTQSP